MNEDSAALKYRYARATLTADKLIRVRRMPALWIESERAAGSIGPMSLAQAVEECTARRQTPLTR